VVGIQKSRGLWDDGIVDLRAPSIIVAKGFPRRIHTCLTSGAETHVLKLKIDRGFTFARAQKDFDSYKKLTESTEGRAVTEQCGFYKMVDSNCAGTGRPRIILATEIYSQFRSSRDRRMRFCTPTQGWQPGHMRLDRLSWEWKAISAKEAEPLWTFWYEFSRTTCWHGGAANGCQLGGECKVGLRHSDLHIIFGAVLPVWAVVSAAFRGRKDAMRVVRTTVDDGQLFVGLDLGEDEKVMQRICGAIEAFDAAPDAFDADDLAAAAAAAEAAEASLGDDWEDSPRR